MNKKILLLMGIVLVVGGAVAAVIMSKDDSPSTNGQSSTQSGTGSQNQSTEAETAVEGNLKTLAGAGKTQECSLSYSGTDGEGSGKLYTDGQGRGRIQLELTTARGNKGEANTLITGSKVYSWTTTAAGGGIGFVFDVDAVQTNSTGSPTTSNSQTAGKNFSLKCKSWDVQESTLTVPTDVNFSALPSSQ
ncbi:MAG TPA: hypothetical protein VJJ78_03740 [Candidatus Saccharimonadales bacterium]|nr:hypothetical protein [Candidatus Saccharimonadales bacterium]